MDRIMGIPHNLSTVCIGLMLPCFAQALVISPVKIDSSQGDPLYAEIPFYYAESKTPIQVSLAQTLDMNSEFTGNTSSVYNFYVRQNDEGSGVIVITSNRPIQETNIDLVLRINDGNQTRIQQIKTTLPSRIDRMKASLNAMPLTPQKINSEKEIALNLPESSSPITTQIPVTSTTKTTEQLLTIKKAEPPAMQMTASAHIQNKALNLSEPAGQNLNPTSHLNIVTQFRDTQPQTSTVNSTSTQQVLNPTSQIQTQAAVEAKSQAIKPIVPNLDSHQTVKNDQTKATHRNLTTPEKRLATPQNAQKVANLQKETKTTQHTVQAKESLWSIAANIAQQNQLPIYSVMQQIQKQNEHAFIGGQAGRLRQGAILSLPEHFDVAAVNPKNAQNTKQRQNPKTESADNPKQHNVASKQSQAHMSIVANEQGKLQGSQRGHTQDKTAHELTVKLQTARRQAVNMQKNVRQLDQTVQGKEQRIALMNARLAEIEKQLKSRDTTRKTLPVNSKTNDSTIPSKL